MNGLIWSSADYGWLAFIVLDGLGAAAASSTGRAFASSWSSRLVLVPAMIALAAAVHFLHYALFQEDLDSLYYYVVSLIIMLVAAFLGYQFKRVKQMSTQYSWAFQSAGLSWRPK
jgi:hypothetical protein